MSAQSKTQQALAYMREHGVTPNAAAKQFKVSSSCLYRAIAEERRPRCPTCGHPIKA